MAARRVAGRTSSRPARCAAHTARPWPERGVCGVHRRAGEALVRAAPCRAARGARRHGDGACSGQPRRLVRDHPRRPAALLAPAAGAGEVRVRIVARSYDDSDRYALLEACVHPLLARIYAARRIRSSAELKYEAAGLLSPELLKNAKEAACLLAD